MALVIGNKTVDWATPAGTTRTFSHNMSTGPNGYLFVVIAMSDPAMTFTSVTYGGNAMTQLSFNITTTTSSVWGIFYLANPPTGANNVVTTFSIAQYNPVSTFAFSATGCAGAGNVQFNNTATSPNSSSITVSANSMIFGALLAGNSTGHIITLDGSSRTLEYTSLINNYTSGAFSATGLTAGSKTVSVAAGSNVAGNYFEIKEFTATSTQGMLLMF
jgi:hypothetical protein